jgi:hypothetical protein
LSELNTGKGCFFREQTLKDTGGLDRILTSFVRVPVRGVQCSDQQHQDDRLMTDKVVSWASFNNVRDYVFRNGGVRRILPTQIIK